ncbi:Uncharacterised protein [Mycobacteroides abscessus subsp. massiliense]|nr:Uncharacterised protein [Mycobacteroides abscessus subsp. massiliense]
MLAIKDGGARRELSLVPYLTYDPIVRGAADVRTV